MRLLPLKTTFNNKTWNLFKVLNIEISWRTIIKYQSIFNTNRAKDVVTIWISYPEGNTCTQMMHKQLNIFNFFNNKALLQSQNLLISNSGNHNLSTDLQFVICLLSVKLLLKRYQLIFLFYWKHFIMKWCLTNVIWQRCRW